MTTARVRLVLASASPARLATLRAAGIEPVVRVSQVDEEAAVATARAATPDLNAADVALLLAQAKAHDVAATHRDTETAFDLVLGCDSVLEIDGDVHGKPATPEEAIDRWRRMRGRSGVLHTGHWLIDERPPERDGTRGAVGATASTTVFFAHLIDAEIESYVARALTGRTLGDRGQPRRRRARSHRPRRRRRRAPARPARGH